MLMHVKVVSNPRHSCSIPQPESSNVSSSLPLRHIRVDKAASRRLILGSLGGLKNIRERESVKFPESYDTQVLLIRLQFARNALDIVDPTKERVYSQVDKENTPPVRSRLPVVYSKAPAESWKKPETSSKTSALTSAPLSRIPKGKNRSKGVSI